MSKKKTILFVILGLVAFWTFGFTVAYTGYRLIRYNPVDTVAIPYLRQSLDNEEYTSQYGAIKSINRIVFPSKTETDTTITAPYSVRTEKYNFCYMVTLVKQGEECFGQSYELYEAYEIQTVKLIDGNTTETENPISIDQFVKKN